MLLTYGNGYPGARILTQEWETIHKLDSPQIDLFQPSARSHIWMRVMAEEGNQKSKARSTGSKNMSLRELDALLDVIEDHVSTGAEIWKRFPSDLLCRGRKKLPLSDKFNCLV